MIKRIAPDKWKHFFVGIAMGAVLQALLWYLLPAHPVFSTAAAFIMVIVISYGFEVFSLITGKGHYDLMDAVAGTFGGLIGITLILVLEYHRLV